MTAADVGAYRVTVSNSLGADFSRAAHVGMVVPPTTYQLRRPGDNVLLEVSTILPRGCTAEFYWQKGNVRLSDGGKISGANSEALFLTDVQLPDQATYRWFVRVSAPDGSSWLESGISHLEVERAPEFLSPLTHLEVEVGSFFSEVININGSVITSKVTGLPPGLSWQPTTRTISGVPTTPRLVKGVPQPFLVHCTATNEYGATSADVFSITVLPPSGDSSGTYYGLVDRHAGLNANLGGTLSMVILKSGSLTGKLALGGRSYPFKSSRTRYHGGAKGGVISIPRPSPLSSLTLTWALDHHITATVTAAGTQDSATCRAALNMAEPDRKLYAGYYTTAFIPPSGMAFEVPQGAGFSTLTVRPSGIVTWTGKLADGSALTFSSALDQDGHSPLHLLTHNKTGSVQGGCTFAPDSLTIDGALDWYKAPQPPALKSRNYPGGWPLHPIEVTGGRYSKPSPNHLLLDADSDSPNAAIIIDNPALTSGILQPFTLAARYTVPVNAANLRITSLNAATGLFGGTFTATDPATTVKRAGTFSGVIVNRLNTGVGHSLLPALPAAGQNVNNTPILSGSVEIKKK